MRNNLGLLNVCLFLIMYLLDDCQNLFLVQLYLIVAFDLNEVLSGLVTRIKCDG